MTSSPCLRRLARDADSGNTVERTERCAETAVRSSCAVASRHRGRFPNPESVIRRFPYRPGPTPEGPQSPCVHPMASHPSPAKVHTFARRSAALVALAAFSLASCSSASTSDRTGLKTVANAKSTTTIPQATIPPTTTSTPEQPGWTPVSLVDGAIAVDTQAVTEADGHVVTIFRFRAGRTRFALHAGSTDPPMAAGIVGPDDGSTVGPDEVPVLLAAFNGGFKANAGAGGFELDSQVIVPLQTGVASLVIDATGSAHVGAWGEGLPVTGEQVVSVRQNLPPLVVNGQPSPAVADIGSWGSTLGGGPVVARSSLGEDASGDLVYAASMDALPSDLANALIGAGVVAGMELDINPEWVQIDVAPAPGGALAAGIPGQTRPSDQYLVGWTRDFIAVLAGP